MAHAGVDHLRASRGGPVTQAVAIGAEERAALDHLPGHSELWLLGVVALLEARAAGVTGHTAGRVGIFGKPLGVPVRRPLPHVPGHVEEAEAVGRVRADGARRPVARLRSPREVAVPVVRELLPVLRTLAPREGRALEASPGGKLPLRLGGKLLPGPARIGLRVLEGNVDDRVVLATGNRRAWSVGVPPACTRCPRPPLAQVPEVDGAA